MTGFAGVAPPRAAARRTTRRQDDGTTSNRASLRFAGRGSRDRQHPVVLSSRRPPSLVVLSFRRPASSNFCPRLSGAGRLGDFFRDGALAERGESGLGNLEVREAERNDDDRETILCETGSNSARCRPKCDERPEKPVESRGRRIVETPGHRRLFRSHAPGKFRLRNAVFCTKFFDFASSGYLHVGKSLFFFGEVEPIPRVVKDDVTEFFKFFSFFGFHVRVLSYRRRIWQAVPCNCRFPASEFVVIFLKTRQRRESRPGRFDKQGAR